MFAEVLQYRKKKNQEMQTDELMSDMERMESDLNKVRLENLRLQKQIKQAQDNLALYANNYNNTSSKFMLPSEFKNKYESMVKESLNNAFICLFDQPKLLAQSVQTSCLFVNNYVRGYIADKTKAIAEILNIPHTGLQAQMLKIYQDNWSSVVNFDSTIIEKLKQHLKNLKLYIPEDDDDLTEWLKAYWQIIVYITLSDQEIHIGIDKIQFDIVEYRKQEQYCMDGFGKEGSKSLVILPSVMRKDQPFNGIKQTVLILQKDFDFDSIHSIEHIEQELKSYNSPKQMSIQKPKILDTSQNEIQECRIRQMPKFKMLQDMKDTLRVLNQNPKEQLSHREKKATSINQDMRDKLKNTFKNVSQWQDILRAKNKENSVINTSNQSSINIKDLIKKLQIDKPIIRKDDQKLTKSFSQNNSTYRSRALSIQNKP